MRIICPACEATYEVPERLLGAGRRLRCKKCGHDWEARPPAPPPSAGAPSPPAAPAAQAPLPPPPSAQPAMTPVAPRAPQVIDPPLPRPEDEEPPRPGLALGLAWGASVLLLAVLASAAWLFRTEIIGAWPPAARLFHLFGGIATG